MYQIKEVADMAGVSVRTLHYYDEIGLLSPKKQYANSYRSYDQGDIKKLQDILFFKSLGFKLSQIRLILIEGDYNRLISLMNHKETIVLKMMQLQRILENLDATIIEEQGGRTMKNQERFEAFDMSAIEKHKKEYAHETKKRYGHTNAYMESERKTGQYNEEDWKCITMEANDIYKGFYDTLELEANAEEIQGLVKDWQNHITRYYYTCTDEILAGLGEMYSIDERFKDNINKHGDGIAERMSEAIKIYNMQ